MKIETYLAPSLTRYYFDTKRCSYRDGWAQLDTQQDASYYGNWVNPFTREVISFAEGDVTHATYESDEEFKSGLLGMLAWHIGAGHGPAKIDCLTAPEIADRFRALGLEDHIH